MSNENDEGNKRVGESPMGRNAARNSGNAIGGRKEKEMTMDAKKNML